LKGLEYVVGKVIWYHPELRVALIERRVGFTVGSVETGELTLGGRVNGELHAPGPTHLHDVATDKTVGFLVEADVVSEEEANELLGFLRDSSSASAQSM
jgi:hypothetical protein